MRVWTVDEVNEHRAAYLAALRSGKYLQGRMFLTVRSPGAPEKNCCLGVACKVSMRDGVVETTGPLGPRNEVMYRTTSDHQEPGPTRETKILPWAVVRWLGIEETDPSLELFCATTMNDREGASFDEIADAFDKYFAAHLPKVGYPDRREPKT